VRKTGLGITFFLLFSMLSIFAQSDLRRWEELLENSGYPDNWTVRLQMREKLEAHPLAQQEYPMETQSVDDPLLSAVKFEFRKVDGFYYIFFINRNPYNYYFEEESKYNVDLLGRGNWIIKRDPVSGDYLQAKIYLQDKISDSYIRLSAGTDRTYLDLYLYGKLLYRHVPLGLDFEQTLYSPMARILSLTHDAIDWTEIFTDASYEEWRRIESVSNAISGRLESLPYVDDGAMDATGNWVFIDSLKPQGEKGGVNCSGFVKWVADGYFQAAPYGKGEGQYLKIEDLKELPPQEETHSWNQAYFNRDPQFGLIWTRNLSLKLWEAQTGLNGTYYHQDLINVPFFEYRADIGYPLEELESLLYLAAVQAPGDIFWGALSTQFRPDPSSPLLWQYPHIFLAIPWFDKNGEFHYKIYESGREGTLEGLLNEYPDSWVHFSSNTGWMGFLPVKVNPALLDLLGY